MRQLLRFGYHQAANCVFAVAVFGMLALTSVVPLPIARYDALLIGCLALTALLWATGVESGREVLVVGLFHLVGLALELFKVHAGSWSYPGEALSKVGGVPLYSGFMYAAVGSYMCQAWRRLDLELTGYRTWPTAAAALFVYANFFTHHWLPDLRLLGAVALLAATWRTTVTFRVGTVRHAMPLAVSFLLIGGFLWLAENGATFLGAWQYPDQGEVWRMVHLSKFGSWALLVSVSFVLVAALKRGRSRAFPHEVPAPAPPVGPQIGRHARRRGPQRGGQRHAGAERIGRDPAAVEPTVRATREVILAALSTRPFRSGA